MWKQGRQRPESQTLRVLREASINSQSKSYLLTTSTIFLSEMVQ